MRRPAVWRRVITTAFAMGIALPVAAAAPFAGGHATVSLVGAQGERQPIADLDVDDDGRYTLTMRDDPFEPKFLSMRPFQCLPAPPKLECHLPYPYAMEDRIADDDLAALSYDLLFLVKQADEFGIDFWNGRYYKLETDGERIVGTAYGVDLNMLASKPPEGVTRPIRDKDRTEIEPSDTPYPTLVIEADE